MTDVTDENPTGITEFDIRDWAAQPEWQPIAQLINSMVRRLNGEEDTPRLPAEYQSRPQDYLADALSHLARGIGFMDSCNECDKAADLDDSDAWVDTATPPYRTEIEGTSLLGTYRCSAGHEWQCGYSLVAPGLF